MGGDVLDPLSAEPHLGRPLPEPVDILLSRLGRHDNSQINAEHVEILETIYYRTGLSALFAYSALE